MTAFTAHAAHRVFAAGVPFKGQINTLLTAHGTLSRLPPQTSERCVGRSLGDPRMAEDCLLEAVRGLRLAHPELGPKPLLAKLREQHPDLGAGNKEVREALTAL